MRLVTVTSEFVCLRRGAVRVASTGIGSEMREYGLAGDRGAVDAPVAADVDELCALLCGPDR